MAEDRKFKFENGRFINRVSGEAIPDDEPVILFRARDKHAFDVLRFYLGQIEDPHHREAVKDIMSLFAQYEHDHPELMKEPGITRDMRLLSEEGPVRIIDRHGIHPSNLDRAVEEQRKYYAGAGNLDSGVPNQYNPEKRGFSPR